jgi:hypothetical protein
MSGNGEKLNGADLPQVAKTLLKYLPPLASMNCILRYRLE